MNRKRGRHHPWMGWLWGMGLWILTGPALAGASPPTAEWIVGVVGDEAITHLEVQAFEDRLPLLGKALGVLQAEPAFFPEVALQIPEARVQFLLDLALLRQHLRHGTQKPPSELVAQVLSQLGPEARGKALEADVRTLLSALQEASRQFGDQIVVTEEEVRAYYEAHRQQFREPDQLHLRQILLLAPREGSTRERARQEAEALRAQLLQGADFQALARKHSQGPTASQGGDLGQVSLSDLREEIARAVASLPEGGLSPVVETPEGFHLFQVVQRIPGRPLPLEAVAEDLRQQLEKARWMEAYRKWFRQLRQTTYVALWPPEGLQSIKENHR